MKVSSTPISVDKSLLVIGKSAGCSIASQSLDHLLQDRRLTPADRNLWLWCLLHAEEGVARPSYELVCPYLSSVPYAAKATADTLHRSLAALRLSGWLCLLPRQRDAATGQVKPSRYRLSSLRSRKEPFMKPAPFELMRPATTDEAILQLQGFDGMAKAMAGGQSLVPMLNLRLAPLERVVDLSGIAELATIVESEEAVAFGACVTHAAIEDGVMVDPTNGFMRKVAGSIAYRAIRNRGTIGGSIALADPSAEWVSLMTALDATVQVRGAMQSREVPARDFMLSAYVTMLGDEELVTAVIVPKFSAQARYGYYKMCRKAGEYASSLAMAVRDPDRQYCRVVIGATHGAPIILEKASGILRDASGWSGAMGSALHEATQAELWANPRQFDDFEIDTHTAGIVAAAKEILTS